MIVVPRTQFPCVYETISYLPPKSDGSIKEQPNINKSKCLSFCNNSNMIQNYDTDGGIYLILSGNVCFQFHTMELTRSRRETTGFHQHVVEPFTAPGF